MLKGPSLSVLIQGTVAAVSQSLCSAALRSLLHYVPSSYVIHSTVSIKTDIYLLFSFDHTAVCLKFSEAWAIEGVSEYGRDHNIPPRVATVGCRHTGVSVSLRTVKALVASPP